MAEPRPALIGSVLRRIRTQADLFEYLADELGWPLDVADMDEERLTWEWLPDEVGIDPAEMSSLRRLRQLRPLSADQPWGIFFVEFDRDRLPVTQFRRVAQAFARRRSRRAPGDDRPRWDAENLLFVVTTGGDQTVQLHLLALWNRDGRADEIRSLAWRPHQGSDRHLARLHHELLPRLAWPADDRATADAWTAQWRDAFKLPLGAAISTAARLAEQMAACAGDLRDQITDALAAEAGSGPFTAMLGTVRSQLIADVDEARFADMCAQTLVYGLLSSRVTSPEDFGTSPVYSSVPLSNPFLEAFFEQVHDEASVLDLVGSGLDQLIADLRVSNVEAILDQFGTTAKGGDPVIHFYEEFLKQYDRKLRADAGAFYTPQPVVDFMVRAVDEVLRKRFGLAMGIADSSTWTEIAQRNGFDVPDGVPADQPFVTMIDPATGTGTFLVAWLRQARKSFLSGGGSESDWSEHLRRHVLPQMHGFELMLGPYAIAHLKVALELHTHGVAGANVSVLLTDSLEHQAAQGQLGTMADPISVEGGVAADLKAHKRFTVVMGNPPYDREQKALGDTGKRKGGVVRFETPGVEGSPLLRAVTEPMSQAGLGGHLKNVYNDYVYFWRWAVWQATELPPGPGVVAFITASSYLDGISMGGVRHLLRQAFDELWIVDLGGEGRGALTEENVFDIQTPVAIAIGVRTGAKPTGDCVVRYLRVEGDRTDKFARLRRMKLGSQSKRVSGKGLERLVPLSAHEYHDWPDVTGLFPWSHSGCQLKRTWPIAESKSLLQRRWRTLLTAVPRRRNELMRATDSRNAAATPRPIAGGGRRLRSLNAIGRDGSPEGIERYGYRSFDRQWIIADNRLADRPRPDLWRIRGRSQVFLTTLTSTKLGWGPVLTVSPYVPDLHHFRGSYGAKSVMPLYRDAEGETANVTEVVLTALGDALGEAPTSEDLLAYSYGLGGTSAFSERFGDQLAEAAGPVRMPMTSDSDLFDEAVALGRDLLWWHTWGERFAPIKNAKLPEGRAVEVAAVSGMPEDYDYDPESEELFVGSGVFTPVSPEVWEFEVSGLRVLPSWLGYRMKTRKGKKSSELEDIRPPRWTQSKELLLLLSILEHTVEVTPQAADLLDRIVNGPLIPAPDLPIPTPAERKPPKS
ncbi:type ISP restriction/modification enzyme [Candidatus Poriferisodalis sp.]|uniref:type ISP restriction/modification enzyme n=1 Tax=Candidatus Poriferisodalis sp. TaxID=3101277 RepID=UPI003B5BF5AE